jgi:F0F1-type ATP synthase assembly protein I
MGTADDDLQPPESERVVTSKYAIGEGSSQGFDFFSSVLAGMLLGLGLDWILDTAPVMVIIGVIAGFVSGFAKLWAASKAIEDEARRRGRL